MYERDRLRQIEERVILLSHAVNTAYDGIVIADLNGRITYTNQAVRDLFGYEMHELIGKGVEVLNPAYTENREMIAAMLAKDGWSGEIDTIKKNGQWFPILLSTSLVRDESGNPVAIMGIVKDLSDVKRAEAEIARRNLELSALNQVTDAISHSFDLDEATRIALDRVIEVTGLEMGAVHLLDGERAELVLAANHRIPDEYARVIQRVKINENVLGQVFQSGKPIYTEDVRSDERLSQIASLNLDIAGFAMVPLRARDRIIGTMSVGSRRPHRLDRHEVDLMVNMGQQVGLAVEKARLFHQVSQDKREWEDTFDAITDLIAVLDTRGRVARVNRALVDRLKTPSDRLIGRPWQEVFIRSGCDGSWKPDFSDGRMGPTVEEVNDLVIEGTFLLSIFPRFGEEREPIGSVLIFRDITEHRRLEEEIRRLDRLSSLGELSAGIAHEIRNPLSSVKLDAQLLGRRLAQDPARRKIVDNILDAIQKIERVVKNTLSYARPEEPEFRSTDLTAVVEQSLSVVQIQLRKAKITVSLDVTEPALPVVVDPAQIQQVFVNLFLNAITAMPSGGALSIRITPEPRAVCVVIQDTGVGIDPQNIDKIFNPFFTTRSQGTGLGLSIVQRILERHHASIAVTSEPGAGTAFTIRFALETPQRKRRPAQASA